MGEQVDVVLDALGGNYQRWSFKMLKQGGVLIALSQPPAQDEAVRYGDRAVMLQTRSSASSLAALSKTIDAGTIKAFIGRTYSMEDIPRAWADRSRQHIEWRIVFDML